MRVKLVIPGHDKEPMKSRMNNPKIHGEHLAYHGRAGEILCGAGNGGAWVRFDGQPPTSYVGCPTAWLEKA